MNSKILSIVASIIAVVLVIIAVYFSISQNKEVDGEAVIKDGVQTINLTAKGGYFPYRTNAKAGIDTIIEVATKNTFDCSSALTIPSINYSENLPPSGVTKISLPPQKPGTVLDGSCSMGMYGFEVIFN